MIVKHRFVVFCSAHTISQYLKVQCDISFRITQCGHILNMLFFGLVMLQKNANSNCHITSVKACIYLFKSITSWAHKRGLHCLAVITTTSLIKRDALLSRSHHHLSVIQQRARPVKSLHAVDLP